MSSASKTVVYVPAATTEAIEYNSGPLGRSLVALAQTLDTDDPIEDEQFRRDEMEIKLSVTQVEIPEGGETQLWVRNLGDTARWDRINDEGVVVRSIPAAPADIDPAAFCGARGEGRGGSQ